MKVPGEVNYNFQSFSFIYKTNYYDKYVDVNQHSYAFPHTALIHLNISPDE